MAQVKPVVLHKSLLDLLPGFQVASWRRIGSEGGDHVYLVCDMAHPDGRRILCTEPELGWIATLWVQGQYVGGVTYKAEHHELASELFADFPEWFATS